MGREKDEPFVKVQCSLRGKLSYSGSACADRPAPLGSNCLFRYSSIFVIELYLNLRNKIDREAGLDKLKKCFISMYVIPTLDSSRKI